jgi:hypothetical protein
MNHIKLFILIIIFQLFSTFLFSQTTKISFLNEENNANFIHLFTKDYVKSLNYYKDLEKVYPEFVSTSNKFYLYVEAAFKNKDYTFAIKLFKNKLKLGIDTNFYVNNYYNNCLRLKEEFYMFQKSKQWKNNIEKQYYKLLNKDGKFNKTNSNKLNDALIDVSYLNGFDQGVRSVTNILGERFSNNNFKEELQKLIFKKLSECDSLNFVSLIKTLKKIENVNDKKKIINKSFAVLIHNFKYCFVSQIIDSNNYIYLKNTLYDMFLNNAMSEVEYAMFIDRSLISRGDTNCKNLQKYGAGVYFNSRKDTLGKLYPIENIENIDKTRSEIGLPPLIEASFEFKFILPENYQIPEKYLKLNQNDINNFRSK